MPLSRRLAAGWFFHGVLLNEQPFIARGSERVDQLVGDVGVVGQRHLRQREAAYSSERFRTENGSKMPLPGQYVAAEVQRRRRRRNGVAPGRSEPFDRVLMRPGQGDSAQGLEDLRTPHLFEAVKQRARIIEHDAWRKAFV